VLIPVVVETGRGSRPEENVEASVSVDSVWLRRDDLSSCIDNEGWKKPRYVYFEKSP